MDTKKNIGYSNSNAIESATFDQLLKTADELRLNHKLKSMVEKEIRLSLPEGCEFNINELGFGNLVCPLFISRE